MKKIALFVFYMLALLSLFVNIGFMINDQLFFNLDDLPEGKFLHSCMSPDNRKTLQIYEVDNQYGMGIRGELITFDSVTGVASKKNIYWQTGKPGSVSPIAGWTDDNVVEINGMLLDLSLDDTFDSRRRKTTVQN